MKITKFGMLGEWLSKKDEEEPKKPSNEEAMRKGVGGLKKLSQEVDRINRERDNRKPKK